MSNPEVLLSSENKNESKDNGSRMIFIINFMMNTEQMDTLITSFSNAEEAEVERFYGDLQDLLKLTPKKDVLLILGNRMQK